jgi:hypothetical protein
MHALSAQGQPSAAASANAIRRNIDIFNRDCTSLAAFFTF